MKDLIIIAAISENNVIGVNGKLPWKISEDLQHFRKLTTGQTVLMGRKTLDSIGMPLPERENIVLTRQSNYSKRGVIIAKNIDEALNSATKEKIYIIGGENVYRQTLPIANKLEITRVHKRCEGDAFFPEIDYSQWQLNNQQNWGEFSYMSYVRK